MRILIEVYVPDQDEVWCVGVVLPWHTRSIHSAGSYKNYRDEGELLIPSSNRHLSSTMPAQTLTEFAERILEDAKYIDAIVAQNPKHKLSHDIDQPPTLSFIEEDASLESARTRIIENVEEISRLVLGPAAYLRKLGWQVS